MNIFIVEDTSMAHVSLQSLLSSTPGVTVVGSTPDESRAIEYIDKLRPDAVILDLGTQSGHMLEALEKIKKRHAGIKVMVMTNRTGEFPASLSKRAWTNYFFDKTFQIMQIRAIFCRWANAGSKPGAAQKAEDRVSFINFEQSYNKLLFE